MYSLFCTSRINKTTATLFAISLLGRRISSNSGTLAFSSIHLNPKSFLISRSSSFHCGPSEIGIRSSLSIRSARTSVSSQHSSGLRLSSSSAETMSTKRVLVPISDGSEEIETCCITDTLTRFGAEVVVASVKADGELKCTMSRGIQILADISIDDAVDKEWDLIALPGGMPGAEHLRDSTSLNTLLLKQKEQTDKKYAAVCASPAVVLAPKNLLPEKGGSTCYPAPGFRSVLEDPSDDKVVVQGNVITSKGPGTSLDFALQLGEELFGKQAAEKIAKEMLVDR